VPLTSAPEPKFAMTFVRRQPDQLAFGVMPAFRRYELQCARYQEMLPELAPLLAAQPEATILDIGSGTGEAKLFLDTLTRRARWIGVEIDERRAEACRKAGYAQILGDLDLEKDRLPLPDESCQVVLASHVLEHLENAEAALAEWMRVLAPGGALILGVPMHVPPLAWAARLRYRLKGRRPLGHCHFFTLGSLRALLAPYQPSAILGFRLFSARQWLPLEDWRWFYRASTWFGRRFPGLTSEVNATLRKPARLPASPPASRPSAD
jgi:SAM-dependent methyltransferase